MYENDGALLEIDRHLTVLPKVLKARPLQMQPPSTELPESEGSENDETGEEDWHERGDAGSRSLLAPEQEPSSADTSSERGRKRERPRGIAGPRGAEAARTAADTGVSIQDTYGREQNDSKRRRPGTGGISSAEGATSSKSGFRPKR